MHSISTETSVGIPYVTTNRELAYKLAKEKNRYGIVAWVSESYVMKEDA